jgi:Zn-dependent peptidase ImmA (M78 family)
LSGLVKAEVELENLLGIKRSENYPPERPLLPGDVVLQAEQDAADLRHRLGLGLGRIPDLISLLEMEIGARVYVRRFDGRISGLFAFDPAVGPCILLNANHPRERRRQSGAHELGHLIATRTKPEIQHDNECDSSREERYANVFGRAFLTPSRSLMQKFHDVTVGSDRLTRRHVIVLAHFFGISREAMVRRLEELRLTKRGTWDWFEANGGITDDQARQVLGDLVPVDAQKAEADRPTTLRLNLLAAEAKRRELMTEGQLSRLLQLDRLELREILSTPELEGGAAHGPTIPLH